MASGHGQGHARGEDHGHGAAHGHSHERGHRYGRGPEFLRSPGRLALLEVPAVVAASIEGLAVASVLDVGTGTGVFAEAFAAPPGAGAAARAVTGLDPNTELLGHARALVPGARFVEGVAEKLPFEDASFDLVFLGHVLHETDHPEKALSEAHRVARLRVVILEWPFLDEEHGPPLAHRLQPEAILELARRAGFSRTTRRTLSHMELFSLSP